MKKLPIILSLALSAVASQAATVAISRSGVGIIPITSTGTPLSSGGYYIGVGTFAGDAPSISDEASLLAAVSSFREFANAVAPISGGTVGTVTGSFTGGLTNATQFNSKEIFVLIGNGATQATSTEFAIIRGTSPTWQFVSDVSVADNIPVVIRDTTMFAPVGTFNTEVVNGTTADTIKDQITLMPVEKVPEPSTTVLGAVLGLGLMMRRRRA